MNSEKGLELTLDLAKNKEKYDTNAKRLFSRKEILAPILKGVVSEYSECTTEEIMELIEGDTVKLGTQAVSPDMANIIMGENSEFSASGEASSRFDVVFRSLLPGKKGAVGVNLHIDLEIQGDAKPGYPIINRGLYYACRKFTMQLQKVNDQENGYKSLEKVYSIWICIDNIPADEQNSIAFYKVENYRNENIVPKDKGDLLEVIIIRLGNTEKSSNNVLDMLNAIFDGNKEKVMNYIPKTESEGIKEVADMLSIIDAVEKKGVEKGEKLGLETGIQGFVEAFQEEGFTFEQIIEKVSKKYTIEITAAEEYVKRFWK